MKNFPPATPQNAQVIYEKLANYTTTPNRLRRVGQLCNTLLAPNISYTTPEAEGEIQNLIRDKIPTLVLVNHPSTLDPFITIAAASRTPFKERFNTTFVWSKAELFKYLEFPYTIGGVPVFRQGSYDNAYITQQRLIDFTADRLTGDSTGVLYPEGTTHKGDPKEVGNLRPGFEAVIRQTLANGSNLHIVTAAIYRAAKNNKRRGASCAINNPISAREAIQKAQDQGVKFLPFIHSRLQVTLDHAVAKAI